MVAFVCSIWALTILIYQEALIIGVSLFLVVMFAETELSLLWFPSQVNQISLIA